MGIYIGNVSNYNSNKGIITVNLNNTLSLGDTISFEKENSKYTVSELMLQNENITTAKNKQVVKIGRMKGNINCGDKIYKLASKNLIEQAYNSYNNVENKKTNLIGKIKIKDDTPIEFIVELEDSKLYNNTFKTKIVSDVKPTIAINSPITEERVLNQLHKTTNTPFNFSKIKIELDNNLYISPISALNELRRKALSQIEDKILNSYLESRNDINPNYLDKDIIQSKQIQKKNISLLLNKLDNTYDYSGLKNIDNIYIPLKYFADTQYSNILNYFSTTYNLYVYMPSIIKTNYRNVLTNTIDKAVEIYDIKGFVISNLGNIELLKKYKNSHSFIANYTFNIFNKNSAEELTNKNIDTITISPELNKDEITNLCNSINNKTEIIVYGNLPVMTMKYCMLGKTNKCYPECSSKCNTKNLYYLKDRMGFLFRIVPDNQQTITTLYNSKITSISHDEFNSTSVRVDILEETIDEINKIIDIVGTGKKLTGQNYTNGNLNKET